MSNVLYSQSPPLPSFLLRSGHVTIEAKGFDVYIVACGSGCTPPAVRIELATPTRVCVYHNTHALHQYMAA